MSQSLVNNYIHVIFSTKHRKEFIRPPYDNELYNYLGGTCKKLDCQPIITGGFTDHVHILCKLSKKIPLMKLLEDLKSSSSKWMKTLDNSLKDFYWQNGYGAFSVNPDEISIVKTYIENQHTHHKKETFQEEYRRILETFNTPYDERYVWE